MKMNHSVSNEIITNRELNRAFSRAVQGCMVDGYDIDGAKSESSWGHAHVVMVKSQRGKKDMFRIVELGDCKRNYCDIKTPSSRVIQITEYKNAHDISYQENGEILSQRFFYRIGQDYSDKCAWTENKDLAKKIIALQYERCKAKRETRGGEIALTPANLLTLTTLVRRHGDRCKCVAPRDIKSATIGRNLYNRAPVQVNIAVQRGKNGHAFNVCVSARRPTDYSLTTPSQVAAAEKLYNKGRDYAICKLIENAPHVHA